MAGAVIHDVQRFGTIASILGKYGFGTLVGTLRQGKIKKITEEDALDDFRQNPRTTASNLREAIEALGTTYIKFGQMLSTRSDLLPKHYIDELSKLQEDSQVLAFEAIVELLNAHYGDWQKHFASIEPTPIGAASIAQVHRAVLHDGRHVVIKVQRPNLLPLIRSDIDILHVLAKALNSLFEEMAYFDLPSIIDEFERTIVQELDFNRERENIELFMHRYAEFRSVVFPEPVAELCSAQILVMQEIIGKKITLLEAGSPEARAASRTILDLAFKMILEDGIFHGDPHPGNVYVTPDGRVALLDFGLVGSFSPRQRELLMRIILAANLGDSALMARLLMALGHPTKRVVLADLESDIAQILQRHLKATLSSIDVAAFINDFVSVGQRHGVRIPSEFTSGVRALINVEGIIQALEPDLDVMKTLSAYAGRVMAETMTQEKISANLMHLGLHLTEFARTVPAHAVQIMQDLEHGGLAVRIQPEITHPINDALNSLSTRMSLSLMFLGLTFLMYLSDQSLLFDICLVISVIWVGMLIVWHSLASTKKRRFRLKQWLAARHRRRNWF